MSKQQRDSEASEQPTFSPDDNDLEQAIEAAAEAQQATDIGTADDDFEKLKSDLDQAERRMLMAQAELENFRKRMRREMDEERRFASLPLIRDLLGVMDNLRRAIEAADKNEGSAGLLEGVKMVASQMETVLDKHHCKPIEALGKEFDPNLHEAISQQPSDEHEAGKVSLVYSQGFTLHDRVIRPAQVIVSTGSEKK